MKRAKTPIKPRRNRKKKNIDYLDIESEISADYEVDEFVTDDELDDIEAESESFEEDFEQEIEEDLLKQNKMDSSDDSLQYYLEEISRYPLLNHEEELNLSRRIQSGDERALNIMIKSNLRLVVKIAKHYISNDYPLVDIIQDGNLGLIKAAKKFDYNKNVRFSTYASWWIKQTIVRSLSIRRRMIRIPHRKEEKLRKIKKAANSYYQNYKKTPSIQELGEILDMESHEIENILTASNPVVSYENNVNEENCTIKNLISDDSYRPDDILIKELMRNEASKLLDSLYPKERMILACRYGFQGGKKFTLKKMGNYFGISAETVRQMEIKALKKLRNQYKHLEEYLN